MPETPDVTLATTPPRKAAAVFILITVLLDMLSIGIMIPVLPQLIMHVGKLSISQASVWMAVFGAAWGLAQFIFSPIQGGLSDSIGRRPVVLFSNFGSGVDYFLMALAPSLWWLLLGRIVSGITAASISTAYAYMSDVTTPDKRAKTFGLMGAAFGVGFVVGPGMGGILGGGIHLHTLGPIDFSFLNFDGNPRYPFFLASFLSLANFLYGFFVLPESLPKDKRKPFNIRNANPLGSLRFLLRSPQVMRLSIMYFMMMFAQSVFPTTMVLYAAYRFGWGPAQVSLMLMAVGVMSGAVQAGLTGTIVKKIGERKTMFIGLICGLIAFTGYGLAPNWLIFVAFMPIGAFWGLATPNIQSLMSSKVDAREQGRLQGANMGLSSLATVLAPLAFGFILAAVTRAGVPVILSGAAFFLAALFMLFGILLGSGVKQSLKVAPAFAAEPPNNG